MMRMQVLREICPKVPEKSRASHGKAKCPDGEVQETKRKRRSSGENRRFLFGVPEGIRTPDLTLRRRTLYPAELLRQVICSAILHLNGKNVNASGEKYGKTLAFCFLRAYNTKVSAENAPRYRISHEKGAFTIAEREIEKCCHYRPR